MLSNRVSAAEANRRLKAVTKQFAVTKYYHLHYVNKTVRSNTVQIIDMKNGRSDTENMDRIDAIIAAFVTIAGGPFSLVYALKGAPGELYAIEALVILYRCECYILSVEANHTFVYGTSAEKFVMFKMKDQHDLIDLPLRFASLSAEQIKDYEE